MGKYGQIIMGPAGAGKSTFTARIQEHVHARGKSLHVVNLDPAAEHFAYDVAVDIRRSSPRFGQWTGRPLSADNRHQLWVPPGFAHGFLVTSEHAEVLYKVTDVYDPAGERAIRWDDPTIGIAWPEGIAPVLSDKDAAAPPLAEAEVFA